MKIRFLRDRSLAVKMVIYICSSVVLLFLAIFLFSYVESKRIIIRNIESSALLLTQKTAASAESKLLGVEKIPSSLSLLISDADYREAELFQIMSDLLKNNPEIYGIAVAYEPYGRNPRDYFYSPYVYRSGDSIAAIFLGSQKYDYFTMDWYQIPKELGRAYWTEPYFDEDGGKTLMTTFSVPFYQTENGQKKFRGIVTADVSLEWLKKMIAQIKVYQSGYCFIISRAGTLVAHPNKELVMNQSIFSLAEERNYPDMRTLGLTMIAGAEGKATFDYQNMQTGMKSWFFYAPIKTSGWSVGLIYPVDELMADVEMLSKLVLLLSIAGALLLIVVIAYMSQTIIKPLRSLARATRQIGAGNFSGTIEPLDTKDEVGELNQSFILMQKALVSYIADLKKTTTAKEKIESELRVAHEIQMSIIPKMFPPFPDREEIDVYATLIPVKEVGGDLYDFFFLDDEHLCFAIGDVSGKGVPASLFMAVTRTLLRARIARGMKPSDIVRILNDDLSKENTQQMFVTFFLGILNVVSGELQYCNAGHNPPYIARQDGTLQLEAFHGYPLGIKAGKPYKQARLLLSPQEKIVLYTDGVTEAENAYSDLFGEEKLEQFIAEHFSLKPVEFIDSVVGQVRAFSNEVEQSDDITMLVVAYYGGGEKSARKSQFFKYTIQVKQNLDELVRVQAELDSLFTTWLIPQEVVNDYQLAFEELMTNIIYYGFNDTQEHYIQMRMNYDGKEIATQLEDDGVEFNPLNTEDPVIPTNLRGAKPGGLGIFLCKQILTNIEYQRTGGKNILTFTKSISV